LLHQQLLPAIEEEIEELEEEQQQIEEDIRLSKELSERLHHFWDNSAFDFGWICPVLHAKGMLEYKCA